MKFIITESKLENIIFKYLDNQDFVKIEKRIYVYFFNSVDDDFSQISYNKLTSYCHITPDLIKEISSFFSLEDFDSERLIGEWVENTLQMKVLKTYRQMY